MKKYGLIGYPLSHSFSKKYFTQKFEKENIRDCEYDLFPIRSIDQLPLLLEQNINLCGLNVTIPYKESVLPFLNEVDDIALEIGAVNCIKITPTGLNSKDNAAFNLKGYNTDYFGFKESIRPFLKNTHEKALILGTGGASKAVYFALKSIGIDCYFASRNAIQQNHLSYNQINNHVINTFKLIINTTPLGTFPKVDECPPIPYEFITDEHFLYDLVYNPEETLFLKKGKEQNALTLNGFDMLKLQAEKAWIIWNK